MKTLNYISKFAFTAFLAAVIFTGCKESAELSTDPEPENAPFTFTPSHGYEGTQVAVEGKGLTTVDQVSIGVVAGTITSKTDTKIIFTVPIGAISGKIKLVSDGVAVISTRDFIVDATPIPSIMSFSPAVVGSGKEVTITGSLLDKVTKVFIGDVEATIKSKSAAEIKITTPVGLKTGLIRLIYNYTTSYGLVREAESKSATQLSLELPVISSIAPSISAINIGQELTITGTMMNQITSVKFGTIDATFTSVSETELKAIVPVGAVTGKIILGVTDGTVESSGNFQVNLPVISNFSPEKGQQLTSGVRIFTINGTKLDLVTGVRVGTSTATIVTQSATNIIFTLANLGATGKINLTSANGTVVSEKTFYITGTFWLADYDNMYTPVRLFNEPMYSGASNSEQFIDFGTAVKSIVNSGGARGQYRRWNTTFRTADASPRMYFRGDQGGSANPAPDRFLLYTDNSVGVTFEFDISFDAYPAVLLDAQNNITLKMLFFNADQPAGGGYGYYSELIKLKYEGPGVWQTVVVNTNLTRVGNDSFMYNTQVPAVSSRKFAPNNCRIICVMFQDAYGSTHTARAGEEMIVNFDNVKFVIN